MKKGALEGKGLLSGERRDLEVRSYTTFGDQSWDMAHGVIVSVFASRFWEQGGRALRNKLGCRADLGAPGLRGLGSVLAPLR